MAVHLLNRARPRRLSRVMAFAAQGVTLKYPSHSWSGLRGEDGVVKEYWAKWGLVARTEKSIRFIPPGTRPAEACLAA